MTKNRFAVDWVFGIMKYPNKARVAVLPPSFGELPGCNRHSSR